MPVKPGVLYLVCGKIASGKTTLARALADRHGAAIISEDALMTALYPDEIKTLEDYRRRARRLESAIASPVADILASGASVVLDFHANTRQRRDWMRTILDAAGADHELHFLDAPDALCRRRLRARNAAGAHEYAVSDEIFDQFTAHFSVPDADEGWTLVRHAVG